MNDIIDLTSDDDELAALLEEERNKVSGGKAASTFADPTPRAGGSVKRAPGPPPAPGQGGQGGPGWRKAPAKKTAPQQRIGYFTIADMLSIGVLVVGAAELIISIACGLGIVNVLFGLLGWMLAWGTWREHLLHKPSGSAADVWQTAEFWLGIIFAVIIGLWGTFSFLLPALPVLQAGFSQGFSGPLFGYITKMFVFWLLFVGYSVGLFFMGLRGGFFTMVSYSYIVLCAFLLMFMMPFSEGLSTARNNAKDEARTLLTAAPQVEQPAVATPNSPVATEQPEPKPPEGAQPGPTDIAGQNPNPEAGAPQPDPNAMPSATPGELPGAAERVQVSWHAKPDPNTHAEPRPWVRQPAIPLPSQEMAWPSNISPLVAVFNRGQTEPSAELWDLSTACSKNLMRGTFDFREAVVLSSDGKHLAGSGEFGIELWSLDSGKLLARLPLDKRFNEVMVGFLGIDSILVTGNSAKNAQVKIWDFSGEPKSRKIELPTGVMFEVRGAAISPGGRYLAAYGQGTVWVVDLEKEELCGMLEVFKPEDPSANGGGMDVELRFSPDGKEFSGVFGNSQGSRLKVWSMTDGSGEVSFDLSDGITNRGKGRVLEAFPDNQGWLLDGRLVVDRTGQAWPIIRHEMKIIGLMDNDYLIVSNDQMLTTWKLPRQADGRLKLATLEIQHDELPTVMTNRESVVGLTGDSLNRASRRYRNQVEVDVLASDDTMLTQTLKWCPVMKQPYLGLRWGVGVQVMVSTGNTGGGTGKVEDQVGALGTAVVNELQERIDVGKFGQYPQTSDPRFSGVMYLGSGTRNELLSTAKAMGLSALVLFQVPQPSTTGVAKKGDDQMKIHVVDVTGKFAQWERTGPNTAPGAQNADLDPEEIANSAAEIGKYIDDNYVLQKMPDVQGKDVPARVKKVTGEAHDDYLPVFAELRYLQVKGLLSNEDAVAAYRQKLSDDQSQAMANGTAAQRRTALEQWLKTSRN